MGENYWFRLYDKYYLIITERAIVVYDLGLWREIVNNQVLVTHRL